VYSELVIRLFPDSPLLHVTRHPLDVALSVFSSLLGQAAHNRRELISARGAIALRRMAARPSRIAHVTTLPTLSCYQTATNPS
jgi:hypothetical protein